MKSVKKLIETIILVIIIVVALLLLGFEFFGESLIKTGIETAGTKALRVGVAIDKLNLALFKGRVEIKGLAVDNPAGYEQKYLLELGRGEVKTRLKSLMSDTVEIESILLDGTTIAIEQKGLDNNLKDVLDSLPKTEGEPEKPAEEGKKLLVKDLKITNTTVKVKLLPAQILPGQADTVELKLDPIEMKDLGSDDKLTTAKLTSKVMVAIANGVAKQGAGVLPDSVLNSVQGALKNLEVITDVITEQGQKMLESKGKEIQESGKKMLEGVEGILKQKEENQ
jgi:uncharacterized protein involved in outer membrane biogenesis